MPNIICKICGGICSTNYFKGDNRILSCMDCGVAILSPELIESDLGKYYRESLAYSHISNYKKKRENARSLLKILSKYIHKGQALLDIGANTGDFVKEANILGLLAIGIEPNEKFVSLARDMVIPVYESSIENFNSEKKFDVITIFDVLEHCNNPLSVLKKINALLKIGGIIAIEVPNLNSFLAKKYRISWKFIALEHLYYFTENNLAGILENLGFDIEKRQKRNIDINYLNTRKLLKYLFPGKISRNRFFKKAAINNDTDLRGDVSISRDIKNIINRILCFLIKLLGREDHILIIARKNDTVSIS